MGLLDEAIREHLELKRRSGADPGDIARAEHEALEPIFPAEPREDADDAAPEGAEHPQLLQEPPPHEEAEAAAHGEEGDFSNVGQETAELDMQAVLNEELEQTLPSPSPSTARPVRAGATGDSPAQDLAGWREPGEEERPAQPEQVPGQERMSFE
jgi:hypothetical protein